MNKLNLTKETLRRISAEEVDRVDGGVRNTWYCDTKVNCAVTTPYKACDTLKTDCC